MRETNSSQPGPILCFGEVLWDCLPHGAYPGGAPINVAYHLRRHGLEAIPVTAVGRDDLGARMLRQLEAWGLSTRFVSIVESKPTGVVEVFLGPDGTASYLIAEDAAWDWVEVSPELLAAAARAAALVFGTLASRAEHNRTQLRALLRAAPAALKIYDVNLRPPFTKSALVWNLAREADLVKLNETELQSLTGVQPLREAAAVFAAQSNCQRICVTAGPRGAGLWTEGAWTWVDGREVVAKDTVGAGDAFLASLIHGVLSNHGTFDSRATLERACRLGEFVAASDGATPFYQLHANQIVTGTQ